MAATGLDVWIGAEPTFTNRQSESPEWLSEALGETKQAYACRIIKQLRDCYPGSIILRTLGRQYAGEPQPRWSLGLYRRRDGRTLADGLPVDPLSKACACDMRDMIAFWQSLADQLNRNGRAATGFQVDAEMGLRILFTEDAQTISVDPAAAPRLLRAPVQSQAIPPEGLEDDLAAEGLYLVSIGCAPSGPENSLQPCIELPGLADVGLFADVMQCVAIATTAAGRTRLVWRGFPPPVDASVAWMTLTPDPAVLEVNEAPAASITEFLDMSRRLFDVVQSSGLAPYRLNYNDDISESGGGGQFTLGGPSAGRSPFFVTPQLLSRLIVYLNHHPSLSYWFAPVYVGSYNQSPRTDENVTEVGTNLASTLRQDDLQAVMVLSDGLLVNGSKLLDGLSKSLPGIIITGGLAGDSDRFEQTWVWADGAMKSSHVCAVGFYGDCIGFGHGSRGGGILGPEREVTRSDAIIAEGVENEEQRDFLLSEGCYEVLGYLYSKPVLPEAISELLLLKKTASD